MMAGLDVNVLRHLNEARRGTDDVHWNARELARNELQSLLMRETDAVIAALDLVERVKAALPVCDRWDVGAWQACGSCTACRVHAVLAEKRPS